MRLKVRMVHSFISLWINLTSRMRFIHDKVTWGSNGTLFYILVYKSRNMRFIHGEVTSGSNETLFYIFVYLFYFIICDKKGQILKRCHCVAIRWRQIQCNVLKNCTGKFFARSSEILFHNNLFFTYCARGRIKLSDGFGKYCTTLLWRQCMCLESE